MCGCRNGRLVCTRLPSCVNGTEPETNDTCQMCRRMPISPVCGNNGQTYHSMCSAMHCGRLQPNETIAGPCSTLVRDSNLTSQRSLACETRYSDPCMYDFSLLITILVPKLSSCGSGAGKQGYLHFMVHAFSLYNGYMYFYT